MVGPLREGKVYKINYKYINEHVIETVSFN